MYILKFVDFEDDLAVKEFNSKEELKEYIIKNNIDKHWYQIEEIKKVIPNLK
ncbi:hypothetical protein [Tepidibacter formicigenes]|jgi:hypothetical protein|uniref:Uncharacterized protein n=1 Tax=Tepidibacter formicigenes DSM 15518 TaxID=1123349 RepID=A0A1M6QXC8_9FIRM|nr:hypothetical protein [Tepidibacter formicigenes]SHK24773.1 hypothetical protein SAMN02744037_01971 [Tepidibacter formicigenes DSM 15518]